MTNESERAQFEAWVTANGTEPFLQHAWNDIDFAWAAWMASIDANWRRGKNDPVAWRIVDENGDQVSETIFNQEQYAGFMLSRIKDNNKKQSHKFSLQPLFPQTKPIKILVKVADLKKSWAASTLSDLGYSWDEETLKWSRQESIDGYVKVNELEALKSMSYYAVFTDDKISMPKDRWIRLSDLRKLIAKHTGRE